jgi:hypothetical protein
VVERRPCGQKESKTEKKVGGGERTVTTTRYEPVWSDKLIDSSKFEAMGRKGHENPDAMRYTGDVQAAKEVRFGAFTLPGTLVAQMSDYQRLLFASDHGKGIQRVRDVVLQSNLATP